MTGPGSLISGRAALALYMPAAFTAARIMIVAPPGRKRVTPDWVRLTRRQDAPDAVDLVGVRVAPPATAVVDCYWERGDDDAPLFTALMQRLTKPAEVRDALEARSRTRCRTRILRVVAAFEAGAESHLEMRAQESVLTGPRLARLVRQHRVQVEDENFRIDAYDEETRTALEFDGDRFHTTPMQVQLDRRRDLLLASIGIQTLRLGYQDVANGPGWCRRLVERTLAVRSDTE